MKKKWLCLLGAMIIIGAVLSFQSKPRIVEKSSWHWVERNEITALELVLSIKEKPFEIIATIPQDLSLWQLKEDGQYFLPTFGVLGTSRKFYKNMIYATF